MINQISFMSANFVARQVGYHMTEGWGQGDGATNDYFRPLETFAPRFDAMLVEVETMGFGAIDLWLAHLHPTWATLEHIQTARELLARHKLKVSSLAGGFGSTREAFTATCQQAVALDTQILGGNTSLLQSDRDFVIATLRAHNLKLGIENHPEKTPQELLAKIGDGGNGTIGTALDTGWFGTQGYDAAQAIEELFPHIFLIHLKDVLAPGAHVTCRYGQGCVPIEHCVRTLERLGYQGGISVEHEPEDSDPTADVVASRVMLQGWLGSELN